VRACRAIARATTECGAHLCGDHSVIVTADTRENAEAAVIERENGA
jgi:hypothetical protein